MLATRAGVSWDGRSPRDGPSCSPVVRRRDPRGGLVRVYPPPPSAGYDRDPSLGCVRLPGHLSPPQLWLTPYRAVTLFFCLLQCRNERVCRRRVTAVSDVRTQIRRRQTRQMVEHPGTGGHRRQTLLLQVAT